MQIVIPIKVGVLGVPNKLENVSPKTILKAKQAKDVLIVADHAGIHDVVSPTDSAQASR